MMLSSHIYHYCNEKMFYEHLLNSFHDSHENLIL